MAAKMANTYSEADHNWQWPEKTWFQQRLNAVKAKESDQRHKPGLDSVRQVGDESASSLENTPLKVD